MCVYIYINTYKYIYIYIHIYIYIYIYICMYKTHRCLIEKAFSTFSGLEHTDSCVLTDARPCHFMFHI